FEMLWRKDWFVVDRFKWLADSAFMFPNADEHATACKRGLQALQSDDIEALRQVVMLLDSIRFHTAEADDMMLGSNILVG
ncbi:MAG: hypothetical protein ACXWC3_20110, partial [Burkholderiales bacterium]